MTLPFRPLVAACFALTLAAATPDFKADGDRWWSHIQFLADDALEGRNTGSPGHLKAAQYVATQFEKLGLKPAGTNGYFQPVAFQVAELDEPHSELALVRNGHQEPVLLGEEATLRAGGATSINAPAVFAGYGFAVPEKNYDDFRGLDVKGKIVVYLSGGPKSIPGPLKSHYQSGAERWKALKAAGALGVMVIQNPKSMDVPWARASLSRFMPVMRLSDPTAADTPTDVFTGAINAAHADKFFAGSGHTMAEILAAADADKPLPHFPLPYVINASVAYKKSTVESQNIVAMLPGTDPALKNEYVAMTAHIDHIGVGEPINGDKIFNGAMDDASGIASMLEVARLLHDAKVPLKRSVIFVAVTGEEKGLQGSRYYSVHPTVPIKNIVADINLDMFLPLHALKSLEVQGLAESTLGDDIRTVAERAGVQIYSDRQPERNLFIRSDQYSFIKQGVPALAFKFGYEIGSPEETLHKNWLKERYHAPSDDLNQPIDKPAAAQFNHIIFALLSRVAEAAPRPTWKPDSFFRRFEQPSR